MAGEEKIVTNSWTWFVDYGNLYATWTANCPPDRQIQIGMGIKILGEPRGEKISVSGHAEFTSVGIGAIHARVSDGKGPCPLRIDEGSVGLIPIISRSF